MLLPRDRLLSRDDVPGEGRDTFMGWKMDGMSSGKYGRTAIGGFSVGRTPVGSLFGVQLGVQVGV